MKYESPPVPREPGLCKVSFLISISCSYLEQEKENTSTSIWQFPLFFPVIWFNIPLNTGLISCCFTSYKLLWTSRLIASFPFCCVLSRAPCEVWQGPDPRHWSSPFVKASHECGSLLKGSIEVGLLLIQLHAPVPEATLNANSLNQL